MDTDKLDVILDMNDKIFVDDLTKALGVEKGESITFTTPQFERTDGRIVSYLPTTVREFDALKDLSEANLRKVGCQAWDGDDNQIHWLYPHEWYSVIPEGYEIVSISDEVEKFKLGSTDDDKRFGALSFGFIQKKH